MNITRLLRAIITQQCLLCNLSSQQLLCEVCDKDLPLFNLVGFDNNLLNVQAIAKNLVKMSCQRLFCMASYQWPYDMWLTQLKFQRRQLPVHYLGKKFAAQARSLLPKPDVLLPVPLHISRYRQRHFNQAQLIADCIGRELRIPVDNQLLSRTQSTAPQTSLSGASRRKNLRKAFCLVRNCQYQHVAIIDDVITTGATVAEVCQLLTKACPGIRIDVWAIAISWKR